MVAAGDLLADEPNARTSGERGEGREAVGESRFEFRENAFTAGTLERSTPWWRIRWPQINSTDV
ncbi:MAG: hypothetical protein WKF30_11760 [Pyrinomonadaceae bacterium]